MSSGLYLLFSGCNLTSVWVPEDVSHFQVGHVILEFGNGFHEVMLIIRS